MQESGPQLRVDSADVAWASAAEAAAATATLGDAKRMIRRPRRQYTKERFNNPLQGMVFPEPAYHVVHEQRLAHDLVAPPTSVRDAGGNDKVYVTALYKHARRLQDAAWIDAREAINLAERDALIANRLDQQPFVHGMRRHRGQEMQRQQDRDTAHHRVLAARESFGILRRIAEDAGQSAVRAGPEPWTDEGPCARCRTWNNQDNSQSYVACFCQTHAVPPIITKDTWISLDGGTSRWLLALPLPVSADLLENGANTQINILRLDGALMYYGTRNKWHLSLLFRDMYPLHQYIPNDAWSKTCARFTCNYTAFARKIQHAYKAHRLAQIHRTLQEQTTLGSDVSRYCVCAYLG